MIRRPAGKDFLLITQNDHARLSGRLAEQIGNEAFDPPSPREEALAAIGGHDAGWPLHDDRPTLNARGTPLHVFETPMALATRIWSESVRLAGEKGAYPGLLASLHQLALSNVAMHHDPTPHERYKNPKEFFELNKFQHQQVELQEKLRAQLGLRNDIPLQLGLAKPGATEADDRLRFNFGWLTAADRISLEFCCGKPLFPAIEGVVPKVGAKPLTLTLQAIDGETLRVGPWPFGPPEVRCTVPARRVRGEPFTSEPEFHQAYAAAPVEELTFLLRPA